MGIVTGGRCWRPGDHASAVPSSVPHPTLPAHPSLREAWPCSSAPPTLRSALTGVRPCEGPGGKGKKEPRPRSNLKSAGLSQTQNLTLPVTLLGGNPALSCWPQRPYTGCTWAHPVCSAGGSGESA